MVSTWNDAKATAAPPGMKGSVANDDYDDDDNE